MQNIEKITELFKKIAILINQNGYNKVISHLDNLKVNEEKFKINQKNLNDSKNLIKKHKDDIHSTFEDAIENGNLDIVNYLLNNYDIDISIHDNYIFRKSCQLGNLKIVRLLLSKSKNNPNFDPAARKNYALHLSCEKGHVEIVKLLIKESKFNSNIDLADDNNYTIRNTKNKDIIELIFKESLTNKKINLGINQNYPLKQACHYEFNSVEIVEMFIKQSEIDKNIDIYFDNNYILKWAFNNNYKTIIKMLIFKACNDNNLEIIEMFIKHAELDKTIDIHYDNHFILRWALKNNHKDIFKMLIKKY